MPDYKKILYKKHPYSWILALIAMGSAGLLSPGFALGALGSILGNVVCDWIRGLDEPPNQEEVRQA